MHTRLTSSLPVNSYTGSEEVTNSEAEVTFKGSKRVLKVGASDDSPPCKQQSLNSAVRCCPEEKINGRSVTSFTPFFYSKNNNPNKMLPWSDHFECIYHSLAKQNTLNIEAQLNNLSDAQIKSLFTVTRPTQSGGKCGYPDSLLELACTSQKAGSIFYRVLFDRLPSEELRHALLESFNDKLTLLHSVSCVMDEPLFRKLEEKLDRQTLLEMVTQPINDLASPLAFTCLYNKNAYLLETVIHENKQLIKKLLTGSPDMDQSLLQFMCNDLIQPYGEFQLTKEEYHDRITYLLNTLTSQERFDALLFTGKSNKSPLLWACSNQHYSSDELMFILTETLDDGQKADLFTAQAETGDSLIQKCLELEKPDNAVKFCMAFCNPLHRLQVFSICTLEGHSFFQKWHLDSDEKNIEYMLRDMDDNQQDLIIAGDGSIWDQTTDSTKHKYMTRAQEQTPIVDAMNRDDMRFAAFLWNKIADPELQIKLLLYKTKHQSTLLQHILDDEDQWQCIKNRFENTLNEALRNSFAAELNSHALAAGRFDDADYYFKQISDSELKRDLSDNNRKCFLLNIGKKTKADIEHFFSQKTPSQCTESVIYTLEHSLYNEKTLTKKLPHLITLQKESGNKDTFVKWATRPQQEKKCPLTTALNRFDIAYHKINFPDKFRDIRDKKTVKKEALLNKQIFQGMISMMSEEQIKEFLLSLKDERSLHLLGCKNILEAIVDTLGDSGSSFLEKINPATGGNLLHILFEADFFYCTDIDPNELVNTVEWLNQNYELLSFLQGRLKNDGSTPLHVLLVTPPKTTRSLGSMFPKSQKYIMEQLCQLIANGLPLVELLKLKDNDGCTPLHKFFSCEASRDEIGDLLIHRLGPETFFKLMHIKDKQGNTVMDHCSKLHNHLHKEYKNLFLKLPAAVKVQEPDYEVSADA
ncbi:hypothetical protein J7438_14665 [Thalassotalea sp. G20_0]|uniref:hypothetical protein n=1 Tax=Thalassotalea sp. G20_0 TaxID=2821093 RepID=UPI001AD9553D|nr:hypothetical protein [Thalassotalea sp. G20_0]MBO9495320.1 hypothetical protein [Thalassotalea sp. G20_0]